MEKVFNDINNITKISNEQFEELQNYVKFLLDYNNKINLIGKSTIEDIWNRHIIDSLQIIRLIKNKNIKIADLGSGAGLPGIPLSIAGMPTIELFEKSPRKCEFLELAKKYSKNKIIVRNENLYDVKDNTFDLIVSRALASIDILLGFSQNLIKENSELIFLKGKKIYEEIDETKKHWNIEYQLFDSLTSNEGKIIKIKKFSKK